MVSLIPFFLSLTGVLTIWDAYVISLPLTIIMLFCLGLYLGKIAKENLRMRLVYGAGMATAGLLVAAIVLLLGGF